MKKPLVSVVIPAFNQEKFIGEQLIALDKQEYDGAFEIIVVNNRSNDRTLEIVKNYKQRISNLRIIEAADKRGEPYATNIGVKASKGNVLLRIDSDDVVAQGWLASMANALSKHHFISGSLDSKKLNRSSVYRTAPFTVSKHKFMGFLPYVIGCNMGFSREAFDSVDGFDEDFLIGCDVDFSWRLQLKGYSIHDVPNAVVYYRYRESVRGMMKQITNYGKTHVYLFKKFNQHGMPRSNTRKALRVYKRLILNMPKIIFASKLERQKYIREVAAYYGRLRGSFQYRTLYL